MALPLSLPPAEFDPSQSRLTFAAENSEILPSSDFTTVQIFADDYYHVGIDLIDPFHRIVLVLQTERGLLFPNSLIHQLGFQVRSSGTI